MLSKSTYLVALGFSAIFTNLCLAEATDAVHLGTEQVSKDQVIELLSPKTTQPLTRGIRLHQPDDSIATESPARALSLEVYFDFDSAVLTAAAKQQLYPVGQALQSEQLANVSFTLEGHTDSAGEDNYNLSLSERRAASVKAFFVNEFQVSPNRVAALGKGEAELLDDANPTSSVNRRVTIIAE